MDKERCGTSVEMVQENYGKYIRSDGIRRCERICCTSDQQTERQEKNIKPKSSETFRLNSASCAKRWRPRRDLNPCYRRERPVSWAELDDGDVLVSRAGFEPATLCLKGRCSTD